MRLDEQDRDLWDRRLIGEGQALVRRCLAINRPGPYQIQAAINAVHSDASAASATDWRQILRLYDQLLALTPSPVVALNRAVAVAEVDGPAAALANVDTLDRREIDRYYLFHAIRADLLRRLGRDEDAAVEYDAAAALTENARERSSCSAAAPVTQYRTDRWDRRVNPGRQLWRRFVPYSGISPRRIARRTASVRFAAPSFPQIEATWNLIV